MQITFMLTATCLLSTDDEGRMIIFKEPIADREMRGHVIKTEEVPNQGSCRVLCFIEPNCVSINFGPKRKGKHRCELNNATEESQTVTALYTEIDYIYLGIEVKCSTVEFQFVQFSCRIAVSVRNTLTLFFRRSFLFLLFFAVFVCQPKFCVWLPCSITFSTNTSKLDKNTPPCIMFSTNFFGVWNNCRSFRDVTGQTHKMLKSICYTRSHDLSRLRAYATSFKMLCKCYVRAMFPVIRRFVIDI